MAHLFQEDDRPKSPFSGNADNLPDFHELMADVMDEQKPAEEPKTGTVLSTTAPAAEPASNEQQEAAPEPQEQASLGNAPATSSTKKTAPVPSKRTAATDKSKQDSSKKRGRPPKEKAKNIPTKMTSIIFPMSLLADIKRAIIYIGGTLSSFVSQCCNDEMYNRYDCTNPECGWEFTVVTKFDEAPTPTHCPVCGHRGPKKHRFDS